MLGTVYQSEDEGSKYIDTPSPILIDSVANNGAANNFYSATIDVVVPGANIDQYGYFYCTLDDVGSPDEGEVEIGKWTLAAPTGPVSPGDFYATYQVSGLFVRDTIPSPSSVDLACTFPDLDPGIVDPLAGVIHGKLLLMPVRLD